MVKIFFVNDTREDLTTILQELQLQRTLRSSVADPDPDPSDPVFFGHSDPDPISQQTDHCNFNFFLT